jgi:hypothetical protein
LILPTPDACGFLGLPAARGERGVDVCDVAQAGVVQPSALACSHGYTCRSASRDQVVRAQVNEDAIPEDPEANHIIPRSIRVAWFCRVW